MTDREIWKAAIKPYERRIADSRGSISLNGKLVITVRSLRKMIYRACDQAATQEIINEAKYAEAMRSNHD
jgi:hypothetical protein